MCLCFAGWPSLRTPFCAPPDLVPTLLWEMASADCQLSSCCSVSGWLWPGDVSRSQFPPAGFCCQSCSGFVSRRAQVLFSGPLCQPATVTGLAGFWEPLPRPFRPGGDNGVLISLAGAYFTSLPLLNPAGTFEDGSFTAFSGLLYQHVLFFTWTLLIVLMHVHSRSKAASLSALDTSYNCP